MTVRPATHAGTWYTASSNKLSGQMKALFDRAAQKKVDLIPGSRVLLGPHAGYTYSGERLAETFAVWDSSKVKRIFMLGPSHHVYFHGKVLVSKYDGYETPFGVMPVDTATTEALVKKVSGLGKHIFKYMSEEVDDDEHLFEMHVPFIYYCSKELPQGFPKIVPILISGMDDKLNSEVAAALAPYLENEENHFIVSSDFCHWGSRFGYTKYLPREPSDGITISGGDMISLGGYLLDHRSLRMPIHESIELLDLIAMMVALGGSYAEWKHYIEVTGNTICGQLPIGVILRMLEVGHVKQRFQWLGYSQSNEVTKPTESSVSYASGYIAVD